MCDSDVSELDKMRFDYAWKWFSYHADQRVKMFNFMLIAFGILGSGGVGALEADRPSVTLFLSVIGIIMSIGFFFLDMRNRDLVWRGESILKYLEKETLFKGLTLADMRKEGDDWVEYAKDARILGFKQAGEIQAELKTNLGSRIAHRFTQFQQGQHRIWFPLITGLILLFFSGLSIYASFQPAKRASDNGSSHGLNDAQHCANSTGENQRSIAEQILRVS